MMKMTTRSKSQESELKGLEFVSARNQNFNGNSSVPSFRLYSFSFLPHKIDIFSKISFTFHHSCRWVYKFRIIGSIARKALGKSQKTNVVNQQRFVIVERNYFQTQIFSENLEKKKSNPMTNFGRVCRVSPGSPTDSRSLSDHKEAKDTPEDNLESHTLEKDRSIAEYLKFTKDQ